MELKDADVDTLKQMLENPMFGERAKDRIRARLKELQVPEPQSTSATGKQPSHRTGEMNQTEARFLRDCIEPRIRCGASIGYLFEKMKFRLATGTWYTPDFVEVLADGSFWIHEVKGGHIYEDSIIKFKVAAEQYPLWRWTKTQWSEGEWKVLRDIAAQPHLAALN